MSPGSMSPMIKGRVVLDSFHFGQDKMGDAFMKKIFAKLDEPLRKLVDEGLVQSSWYPVELLTQFMERTAEVMGVDQAVYRKVAEDAVARQLSGTYRSLAHATVEEHVRKGIVAHQTYFRNVSAKRVLFEANRLVIRYEGFAAEHRMIEPVIAGFVRQSLTMAGAKNPTVHWTVPVGDPRGYAEYEAIWS